MADTDDLLDDDKAYRCKFCGRGLGAHADDLLLSSCCASCAAKPHWKGAVDWSPCSISSCDRIATVRLSDETLVCAEHADEARR